MSTRQVAIGLHPVALLTGMRVGAVVVFVRSNTMRYIKERSRYVVVPYSYPRCMEASSEIHRHRTISKSPCPTADFLEVTW